MTTTHEKSTEGFWVRLYGHLAEMTIEAVPVRIMSWGKQQGTAVRLDQNRNAQVRFFTDRHASTGGIVLTREEVEAYAPQALECAARNIVNSLNCEESNFNNLRPQYREAAAARIAALKVAQPSYKVIYRDRV